MKNRLFFLICFVILILTLLCSCNLGEGKDPADNGSDPGSGDVGDDFSDHENLIYGYGSELSIVYTPSNDLGAYITKIYDGILYSAGIMPILTTSKSPKADHEIVVGKTDRDISVVAYDRLSRVRKENEDDFTFLIYSDGSSVAIAYEEDENGFALECAMEYFLENYIASALILSEGTKASECIVLRDQYLLKDEEYYANAWKKLEEEVGGETGKELVEAFKVFYSLYTPDIVSWFANLYDPETGGFYYSNSARDNYPFLPDAESTNQALGFISASGLARGIGGTYKAFVPDWMAEQIVDFIYNLQDPDGYFYHPQWGKEIGTSRRSRDYNWCRDILKTYNVKTKYPTIGDVVENEPASVEGITGRLGTSSVKAVSKVVSAASSTLIPDHLKTVEAFKTYLISLDVPHKSYSAGNTLSSQGSQIRARGVAYVNALVEHLNACQYDNGLWHDKTDYYGVNGLMKISGVYSSCKAAIPNAELACQAAIAAISSDEVVDSVVDLWNAWEATIRVLSNIKEYDPDGRAKVAEIQKELRESSVEIVKISAEKLGQFRREDGSFSYKPNMSSPTSQGVSVAISGTCEGDVNGTVIATTHMIKSIFTSLGLANFKVYFLGAADRYDYLNILENLGPIEKQVETITVGEPITFDDEDINMRPESVTVSKPSESKVINDDRGSGKVLSFESKPGSGDYVLIKSENQKVSNASCYVFEGEFCIKSIDNSNDVFRLEMGIEGDKKNIHRMVLRPSGDKLSLWEVSSSSLGKAVQNELGMYVSIDEWFKIRVEYYNGDSNSVRIKIFFNDKLCAVTDNYFDYEGIKLKGEGTPLSTYREARIYVLKDHSLKFYCDNLHAYRTYDKYVVEELDDEYEDNRYSINVDRGVKNRVVHGFEEGTVPNEINVNLNEGDCKVSQLNGSNALLLSGDAGIIVPYVNRSTNSNSATVEFDIALRELKVGDFASVSLIEQSSRNGSISTLDFFVYEEAGQKYVGIYDNVGKKNVDGVCFKADSTAKVKLVYFKEEGCILVFVNGSFSGICSSVSSDAKKYEFMKLGVSSLGGSAFYIDNVSVERTYCDFEDATKPKYDSSIHDFENGLGSVIVSGEGAMLAPKNSVDKELKLDAAYEGTIVTIPVNRRDDAVNTAIFELVTRFERIGGDGELCRINFTDENGSTVLSFSFEAKDGKIYVKEVGAFDTYFIMLPAISSSEEHTLSFEYYTAYGVCLVYLDGNPLYEGAMILGEASTIPSNVTLSLSGGEANIYVDDVKCETLSKIYKAGQYNNPDNSSETVTFDYSGGEVIPSRIKKSLNSVDPSVLVKEVLRDNAYNKVLAFKTTSAPDSPMDYITFSTTSVVDGAVSYVFESDVMFGDDVSKKSTLFQLNLTSGGTYVVQIQISSADGGIHLAVKGGTKYRVADIGQWFKLRTEFYTVSVNGILEPRTKIFVNEIFVFETNNLNSSSLKSSLTGISLNALKSATGTVYLDNMSFKQSTKAYEEE